jgi:hypothetical protein
MKYANECCDQHVEKFGDDVFLVVSGAGFMACGSMEVFIPIDEVKAYGRGALIQDAMPSLTVDEREFLISGCTPEYWAAFVAD